MGNELGRFGWRFYFVAFVAVVALACFLVPWRPVVEARLRGILVEQGFEGADFTLSDVGLDGATLENIKLGGDKPLTLSQITLHYSLSELLAGKLNALELSGLSFDVRQENNVWKIGGLEEWQAGCASAAPFTLPVSSEALAAIPVKTLRLEGGSFHLDNGAGEMDAPLSLSWNNEGQTTLTASSQGISFKSGALTGMTGAAMVEATANPDQKKWDGNWKIEGIALKGIKEDLPVLEASGSLTAYENHIEVRGSLASADSAYHLSFAMNMDFAAPEKSLLTILDTSMPWMQGKLSAQKINIPLGARKALRVNLNLQNISVAALLKELTGKEAVATGALSGTLPVTFSEKGELSVQDGTLQTNESGTIKMPPDSIPGDNPQVAFMRDVLKDFHYTLLSAKAENTPERKLSVALTIEGNNPNVQGGRPVKINVHLNGDLLDLIQQNIMLLYDPKKLIDGARHP